MATATTETMHPARRPDVEREFDDKNVKWDFDPAVPVEEFDKDKSLTNQARFEPLNPAQVELYTAAMERGDEFPAVIAYYQGRRLVMIDGNHRLNAALGAGISFLPTYKVDVGPEMVAILTYLFNGKNGLPSSPEERMAHAVYLIDNGATRSAAASVVGLTESAVERAVSKARADRRAAQLGVKGWQKLSVWKRTRLGQISTDAGFLAASHLAQTATLNGQQIDRLVVELNKTRSEQRQVELVKEEEAKHNQRIQDTGAGLLPKRRQAKEARTMLVAHLGYLDKMDIDRVLNVVHDQDERKNLAQRCRDTADTLGRYADKLEGS